MGRQLGRLAGDAIRAAYRANVRAPLFDSGRARYGFAVRTFYSRTWISYPSCVRELFRGVCETSGIPLEQLVFNDQRSSMLSCYADGETGGDSLFAAAWGDSTDGGKDVLGRQMGMIESLHVHSPAFLTVFIPTDGSHSRATWGSAGCTSETTTINDQGLFRSLGDFERLGRMGTTEAWEECCVSSKGCLPQIHHVADETAAWLFTGPVRTRNRDTILVAADRFLDVSLRDRLRAARGRLDAGSMMTNLDSHVDCRWGHRAHQIVMVPEDLEIWVRAPKQTEWHYFDLWELFSMRPGRPTSSAAAGIGSAASHGLEF